MGVVQNTIDIEKSVAKLMALAAEIGDENSGIIKDIDDLQEANAQIMTSVRSANLNAELALSNTQLNIGDSFTENSNPAYVAALFQSNKELRLLLPFKRRIVGNGITMTIGNLQLFKNGNYEQITSGLTVSANLIDEIGAYLIITSENAFTTYSALDTVMARLFNFTITVV